MKKKIEKQSALGMADLPLGISNYKMMIIGLVIIVLGFILMITKTNIYSFRAIGLADIIVVSGFVFEIYAIMSRPKESNKEIQV
jgi:hypothetical protein